MLITSFFTSNGTPKTGLVGPAAPTIRIWEVSSTGQTLVVNNDAMTEVGDGFYKYAYTTGNAIAGTITPGYGGSFQLAGDVTAQFTVGSLFMVSDSTMNNGSYTVASSVFSGGFTTVTVISTEKIGSSIVDGYIDTLPLKDYVFRTNGGSVSPPLDSQYEYGATDANRLDDVTVQQITNQVWDEPYGSHTEPSAMGELIRVLVQIGSGRTKIDTIAKTLTIYDEDCVTPLAVFNLLDSNGNYSVTEVCERKPTSC